MTVYIYMPSIYPCRDKKWIPITEALGDCLSKNIADRKLFDKIVAVTDKYHYVPDADTCGDEDHYAVTTEDFKTFTFHKVAHNWWIEYSPEWKIHNTYDHEEVDSVPFEFPTAIRDWIIL